MDTSHLFQAAFGSGAKKERPGEKGQGVSPDEREAMFQAAFGTEKTPTPTPNTSRWRLNNNAAKRLSFGELYEVQDLLDRQVPYSELPNWVRDQNIATPSKTEKKLQDQLTEETGLTLNERSQLINAFEAEVGAIAEMHERELLRGSQILLSEYQKACDRFGADEVQDALAQISPEALASLKASQAEKAAKEEVKYTEEQTRADLENAKRAIEMLGGSMPEALAREAAIASREAAEQGE